MSRSFDPNNPSNPYDPDPSQNPYNATRHSGTVESTGLIDDLVHHIKEREFYFDDIFRVSFRLYGRYFRELGAAALVYGLALAALNFVMVQYLMDWLVFQVQQNPEDAPGAEEMLQTLAPYLSELLAMTLAMVIAQSVLILYTVVRTGERCRALDQAAPVAESLRIVLQRLPVYLPVVLISYASIFGGLLLCVVPGVALAVYFSLLAAMVGIGGLGFTAFGQSFALLRGRFIKTLGILVVLFMTLYILPLLLSSQYAALIPELIVEQIAINPGMTSDEAARAVLQSPRYYFFSQLPNTIGSALLHSFMGVLTAVMYINYTRANQNPTL